jgi:hypothetical protein
MVTPKLGGFGESSTTAAFPSEDHFVSWLRLCPRTPISGGTLRRIARHKGGAVAVFATARQLARQLVAE